MRLTPIAILAAAALALGAAPAAAQSVVTTPSARTLYQYGPSGRYLMDGPWLFKLDARTSGPQNETSTAGWTQVTVPNAWNAGDDSDASFAGAVGWYRKDFRLPSARRALSWIVRFESVNYRTQAWLNGRRIGDNTGAYLPFEFDLPRRALKRRGVNRLVVRVDSRRLPTDFPPSRLSQSGFPTGGWWNYGGLLREVYLRQVEDVDLSTVQVLPDLRCRTCAATVRYRVVVRNAGPRAREVRVAARFGSRRLTVGTARVPAGRTRELRRNLRVRNPRLWSPVRPFLYDAPLTLSSGGRTLQRYTLRTGVRSIKVSGGRLVLNGRPMNFRGIAVHEDDKVRGFAIDNAKRDQMLAWARELGATLLRSHYPLHPYTQERADALGIMQWSEVPVYGLTTEVLGLRSVRVLAARELESNVETNGNHPSVIIWSIANELSSTVTNVQADYIRRATTAAKALDPTRPVGIALAGYPSAGCQAGYAPLDVIGVNEYFGWYVGPGGQIADRGLLSGYLDQVRNCYPRQAVVITEFGAEANRDGPVEERGTYAHQQDFVNFHSGVYATKPWLSGAIYWTLQEFRVRPGWEGGNPRANPPLHQKAVITQDGVRKPAFFDLQRWFRATRQFSSAG